VCQNLHEELKTDPQFLNSITKHELIGTEKETTISTSKEGQTRYPFSWYITTQH
jgi:hypothetical protein